ncbi:MAG: acyl-CoA-binding protein [Bacteroidota bacterium]
MIEEFNKAVERSKALTERPSNEDLLQLYALYKQAVQGDVKGERPGGFDFKGAAKYDSWSKLQGMADEQAMSAYIDLVEFLHRKEN